MSEVDVRHEGIKLALTANLIVHHNITDTFNQTIENLCILGIGEESQNPPLFCQWNEFLEDISQFPGSAWLLGLDLGHKNELTVPAPSSLNPPLRHPQKQVYTVWQKGP